MKNTTGWGLLSLIIILFYIIIASWYGVSLRFTLAEKAVLAGQRVTVAIDREQLAESPNSPSSAENPKASTEPLTAAEEITKPSIIILLTGFSKDNTVITQAMQLPEAVAFGFASNNPSLPEQLQLINHHPVFLEVTVNTQSSPDIQYALSTSLNEAENTTRLNKVLTKIPEYVGIYSFTDPKTLFSLKNIRPFLDSLKARNLLFVMGNGKSEDLNQLAAAVSLPLLEGDVTLNADNKEEALKIELEKVETTAKENGQVLIIGEASPIVIEALHRWIPTLAAKGLKIAPITDMVRKIE